MKQLTVKEVKQLLQKSNVPHEQLEHFKNDERKGVQQLVRSYERKQQQEQEKSQQYEELVAFDNQFRRNSNQLIAGVDEAGRGPLAGPVVAAAVILPKCFKLIGLTDSKQLTNAQRQHYYEKIVEDAVSYHVSVISNHVIDELNIYKATKKAMTDALDGLTISPDIALIDAMPMNNCPFPTESIIKGDDKSLAIAAASVLAKVTRDHLMDDIHIQCPEYNFQSNKGYGTKEHITALKDHGITIYHRKTFAPIRDLI